MANDLCPEQEQHEGRAFLSFFFPAQSSDRARSATTDMWSLQDEGKGQADQQEKNKRQKRRNEESRVEERTTTRREEIASMEEEEENGQRKRRASTEEENLNKNKEQNAKKGTKE